MMDAAVHRNTNKYGYVILRAPLMIDVRRHTRVRCDFDNDHWRRNRIGSTPSGSTIQVSYVTTLLVQASVICHVLSLLSILNTSSG